MRAVTRAGLVVVCATAVILVIVMGTTRAAGPSRTPGASLRVGVVDIAEISQNYEKFDDVSAALKAFGEEKQKKLDELRQTAEEKEELLQMHRRGTEKYDRIREEIIMAQAQFKIQKDITDRVLNERKGRAYLDFHKALNIVVRDYAHDNGIDLVLKTADTESQEQDMAQTLVRLSQQEVLYFSDSIDITKDVLAILNAK